jgi:FkbM family methyltransferase
MPGYYMTHDKNFLENADLSMFNKKILDLNNLGENIYIFNIIKELPENAVVLDIGSYTGDTSIYISKKLKEINRSDIKIICFEPNTKHCSNIINYKEHFGLNIEVYNKIISDCEQRLYMKKNEGAGTMYDTCYKNNIYYDSISLDSLELKNIQFCKIDVEGHEPEVLAGAINTLLNCKYIYIEMWNDEHFKSRHGNKLDGSHNKRILNNLKLINNKFKPIQKIEKNILFQNIE